MSPEGPDNGKSTSDQGRETPVRDKSLSSSASKPVIFAVDSGAQSFLRIGYELRRRYGAEYQVVCDSSDRKSTRLNSSHANISYAVFCLKKKKSFRYDM